MNIEKRILFLEHPVALSRFPPIITTHCHIATVA